MQVLSRFYEITSGSIRLGPHDFRSFPVEEWREAIAVVTQEPTIFSSSIYKNITYGSNASKSRDKAIQAAQASNAEEFILKLSDG